MAKLRYLSTTIAIVFCFGCGGDGLTRVHVQGKVTAKGVPIGDATVSFIPMEGTKGEGGIGTTDAGGG